MASNLTSKAVLATLHVQCWSGTITDHQVARDVEIRAGATGTAGRYSKILLSKEALQPLQTHALRVRKEHRYLTLPWDDGGDRLLPIDMYQEYRQRIDEMIQQYSTLRATLLAEYVDQIEASKKRLGSLFNAGDYPSVDQLKNKIEIRRGFTPIPDTKHFVADIGAAERARIQKDMEAEIESRIVGAVTDLYKRLHETTSKVVQQLQAKDDGSSKPLRNTLLANLRTTLDMVAAMNLTDSVPLKQVCSEILAVIKGVEIDTLRENTTTFNPQVRTALHNTLEDVTDRLAGYFGDSPLVPDVVTNGPTADAASE